MPEGTFLQPSRGAKIPIAKVSGPACDILRGELVALNAIAECSAVATAAYHATKVKNSVGWSANLAATRKTAPGLRLLQKYGVILGGMDPHRMDLSSMVMLQDNHIAASGSITAAVNAAKHVAGFSMKVDVECSRLEEAVEACEAGADVVMLDNFEADEMKRVAGFLKGRWPRVIIEGSGLGVGESGSEKLQD